MRKISVILFLICFLWSVFVEPNLLCIKNYDIKDANLVGLRVVLISDLHLKPKESNKLNKIVTKINALNPDMVLITGDFLNGSYHENTMSEYDIAKGLKNINTKYGIYAVLGNHDCVQDETLLVRELENAEINVLRNNNIFIKDKNLYIAGVDDDTTRFPDVQKALSNTTVPRILLMHSPDEYDNLKQEVNLVVAGHNHAGQISLPILGPLFVPAKTGRKYAYGYTDNGFKKLIVTSGIGTSIVNARFNCLPEIVLISFN